MSGTDLQQVWKFLCYKDLFVGNVIFTVKAFENKLIDHVLKIETLKSTSQIH